MFAAYIIKAIFTFSNKMMAETLFDDCGLLDGGYAMAGKIFRQDRVRYFYCRHHRTTHHLLFAVNWNFSADSIFKLLWSVPNCVTLLETRLCSIGNFHSSF